MEQTHQTLIAEYLDLWHKYWIEMAESWSTLSHYNNTIQPFPGGEIFSDLFSNQFYNRGSSRVLQTHMGISHAIWAAAQEFLGEFVSSELLKDNKFAGHIRSQITDIGIPKFSEELGKFVTEKTLKTYMGVMKYMSHPYKRPESKTTSIWHNGSSKLLDYGGNGPAVLFIPSLVNRSYILDLMPQNSLVEFVKQHGLRPYLLDWGKPQQAEQSYDLSDYISNILLPSIERLGALHGKVHLVGYCMGGDLALAAAATKYSIDKLILIATPWDFSKMNVEFSSSIRSFDRFTTVPGELIQSFLMNQSSTNLLHKFVDFYDKPVGVGGDENLFVAIEDWVNDSVDLSVKVARDCWQQWFVDNLTNSSSWQVGTRHILPEKIENQTLIITGARDKLVPPDSSTPLADQLPNAKNLQGDFGHTSLVTSIRAKHDLWSDIVNWLRG